MGEVLIRGIEMPKRKENRFDPSEYIPIVIHFDGRVTTMSGGYTPYRAIPVPPHGRLIDADALAKDLDYDVELDSRLLDDMNCVGKEREHTQFDKDCKQNCMWLLTETPTVIPASE